MEQEAANLRAMLELLDQIEALMNDAAYSEMSEKRVATLRRQWTDELNAVERKIQQAWPAPAMRPA